MMWRVINSGKSACLLLTLHSAFFDHYVLYQTNLLNTSVLLKVRACGVSWPQVMLPEPRLLPVARHISKNE
jgi:hypothetical protein